MKRSLKEMIGYDIKTKDGDKGRVKDFLFDEEQWKVRYLEADLGFILPGKKVLIPNIFLKEPDWLEQSFPVNLKKEDIENCPLLEDHLPVSRKYEQELHQSFDIPSYWTRAIVPPVGAPAITYPPRPTRVPIKIINEKELDTSLRSFNEVNGYHIHAIDGQLGHITDIIIDDIDWQILYAVVDTSNWLPWSKKVLVSTLWMDEISYVDNEIIINLHIKTIKSAPEFDYSKPINEAYEKKLYDYYGRPVFQK